MYGFYRLAAAAPMIKSADVNANLEEMCRLYSQAAAKGAALVFFPELALSGVNCGDLFFQEKLLASVKSAMQKFAAQTEAAAAVFGLPFADGEAIYDLFAVASNGELRGFIPVKNADPRYFKHFPEMAKDLNGVPCGHDLIFDAGIRFTVSPRETAVNPAAEVLLRPCREPELPGYSAFRRRAAAIDSSGSSGVILLCGSGRGESTTDGVLSGQALIASFGGINGEIPALHNGSEIIFADVDFERLRNLRRRNNRDVIYCRMVTLPEAAGSPDLSFAALTAHPFLPEKPEALLEFCRETLELQSAGLARRMEHCHARKMVLGISGGLDSTLALLVLRRCCLELGRPASDILAVTMPGFGTTNRTRNNALRLAELIGAGIREIPIAAACLQHFRDIGHDESCRNSVYENSQARERTQILMDLANGENGLVIGTGDLSELALGWCTYNGDQMSMYAVNASIPKSVIPALLEYESSILPEAAEILNDVIATPVSPELLPCDENGDSGQQTESILGAYELHDFFLYHFYSAGAAPEKIRVLAEKAFAGLYGTEEIERCLKIFIRRFFSQQFKRSAAPDGVQAGIFSMSPRGGLMMPSDAAPVLWQLP